MDGLQKDEARALSGKASQLAGLKKKSGTASSGMCSSDKH
jgi:hypothetical protein